MNLQPVRETITVGKEFVHNTQGLIAKVGGVTIDASAFTPDDAGYLKAGSAVFVANAEGSLAVPFVAQEATDGIAYVTINDVKIEDGDAVVGAYEEAYLKKAVVQTAEKGRTLVTDAFVAVAGGRYKLR